MDEALINMRGVSVGYGDKCLVAEVNLDVSGGEMVSMLGANGAGKSTLLRTICGELVPLRGKITVGGIDTYSGGRTKLARALSMVTTDRVDQEGLSVRDVVAMGRYPHTGFFGRLDVDDIRIVEEALSAVGMTGYIERGIGSLSDGERQKVMVARALAQDTPVMVLDEPAAFLDVASRVELNALLASLARERGKAVVMSSHDVAQSLEQSTRIWLLTGDGTMTDSTPAELLDAYASDQNDSPLGRLFAGRNVVFDIARLDYVIRKK